MPDNQEVYADTSSDASIIVELLEADEDIKETTPALHHFKELAEVNQATDVTQIMAEQSLNLNLGYLHTLIVSINIYINSRETQTTIVFGTSKIAKYNYAQGDPRNIPSVVYICLANIRVPSVSTDILITYNLPINAELLEVEVSIKLSFVEMMTSFKVLDWNLFV